MSQVAKTDLEATANSRQQIRQRVEQRKITWNGPLLVVVSRTVFILLAQGVVAVILWSRGAREPWLSAGSWWTVYATLVDVGCLTLLWKFTRAEGIKIRDLVGPIRLRYGRDLLLGAAVLLVIFPLFAGGGTLASRWLYGVYQVNLYPGILSARVLPVWAVFYSRFIWWMIWSPTEEMTYAGYALPRIEALSGRKWVAVAIVGFWWTVQHPFLPFIADWRCFLWRFVAFLAGVLALVLIYLRIRRLAPLILAHWVMDIVATVMTLK
ncbi:MAG TPA: CPBP family glutamic-type intramembrane protease [Candidatus Saccharimonadales bacterium]|nr:CPBP family glutamic-type intramembrane protease [Candidatus Saccharimonadales bacterium]